MIISHLGRTILFILLQEKKTNAIGNGDRVVIATCPFCTTTYTRTTTYFYLIVLLPNRFPIRDELVAPILEDECRGSSPKLHVNLLLLASVGLALNIS